MIMTRAVVAAKAAAERVSSNKSLIFNIFYLQSGTIFDLIKEKIL